MKGRLLKVGLHDNAIKCILGDSSLTDSMRMTPWSVIRIESFAKTHGYLLPMAHGDFTEFFKLLDQDTRLKIIDSSSVLDSLE
jgi:hypothetical protein